MTKKKILITVKTYPTISVKYDELVCTAGIDKEGNWIRIYPMPFRKLDYIHQYKKYQWIEVDLVKNKSDFRPESFAPRDIHAKNIITFLSEIGTEDNWYERKRIVLRDIEYDMSELILKAKNKDSYKSLAVFKPSKIKNFICERVAKNWSTKQTESLRQENLFDNKQTFEVIRKLPYKFSYVFSDINGKESTLMNEDWEVGVLFWNCLKNHGGNEQAACDDVRKKYWDDFTHTKDLYFSLGTTKLNQLRAPNPFIIIGTFHPPKEPQARLKI